MSEGHCSGWWFVPCPETLPLVRHQVAAGYLCLECGYQGLLRPGIQVCTLSTSWILDAEMGGQTGGL